MFFLLNQRTNFRSGRICWFTKFGFTKEEVITALYNSAEHVGLGVLSDDGNPLSKQDILDALQDNSIDYLKGKPLKIDLENFPYVLSKGYDTDSPIKMKDVLRKMKRKNHTNVRG